MGGTERFAIEQNVWRLIDRLVREQEPEGRATIAHLLQKEEDKYARGVERYEIVQRWIEKCDRLIAHNSKLMGKGPNADRALLRNSIRNMEEIKATLLSLRTTWSREMDDAAKFASRD
jgi:ribosomal 50S subunit-associated protein YjgA (DUF615 family)